MKDFEELHKFLYQGPAGVDYMKQHEDNELSRRTGAASPTSRLVTGPETILTSGPGSVVENVLKRYPHEEIKQALETYQLLFSGPSTSQSYDSKLDWLMQAVVLLLKAHQ